MLRMRSAEVLGLTLALVGSVREAKGQSVSDTIHIEMSASRAMLAHLDPGNTTFALDPRVASSEQEAPTNARVVRAENRTAAITKALGGRVQTLEEVTCGMCHLNGVSAHLSLASPQIYGSTATITATSLQNVDNERQPVYYQTVCITLSRTKTGWTVTREEQLSSS